MNLNVNWGAERASELRAEAQQQRLVRQLSSRRPQPVWTFLRFLLLVRRARLA